MIHQTLDPTADLELALTAQPDRYSYSLALRLTRLGDTADLSRGPFPCTFEPQGLLERVHEPRAYGDALRSRLFATPAAEAAFSEMRAVAQGAREPLRIRLLLPATLQGLRWETLVDPVSRRHLALEDEIYLSRYLQSNDYRPVIIAPRQVQKALVAIAAPSDSSAYGLAGIDAVAEGSRASDAFKGVTTVVLGVDGHARATIGVLSDHLRSGYDILYLMAHGVITDDGPKLFLTNDDGLVSVVAAGVLADLIGSLGERRPRLVVLASCHSAGNGGADALSAMGQLLALAGVPAVVAMQGLFSISTASRFLPLFVAELIFDGFIERALVRARQAVAGEPDWWVPTLFSRLRSGRLWEPGARPLASPAPAAARTPPGVGKGSHVQIAPSGLTENTGLPLRLRPELVYVPGGPFLMGSNPDGRLSLVNETPQHHLELPDYWIGKTAVTNAQFRPFVEGDGYRNKAYWLETGWAWREKEQIDCPAYWEDRGWNGDQHPVVGVSWFEAVAYCRWLEAQVGYPVRLPSEAEWEKAARGGDGRIWPWGNSWDRNACNSQEAKVGRTTPVGQYKGGASFHKVLDMAGNVFQWCATREGKTYPWALEDQWTTTYLDLSPQVARSVRGGSWQDEQHAVRAAKRYAFPPDIRTTVLGLRVVCPRGSKSH